MRVRTLSLSLTLPPPRPPTLALASRVVTSRAELEALLHTASLYRTTDATNCNEVRSPRLPMSDHYYWYPSLTLTRTRTRTLAR